MLDRNLVKSHREKFCDHSRRVSPLDIRHRTLAFRWLMLRFLLRFAPSFRRQAMWRALTKPTPHAANHREIDGVPTTNGLSNATISRLRCSQVSARF